MALYPAAQGPWTHEHMGAQGFWNHVVTKEFFFFNSPQYFKNWKSNPKNR